MAEQLTLMAVHAHPDDEISTGGTFAKYAEQGIGTVLVTCTLGEEGEIVDPTMVEEEVRPRLGQVREAELRCAVETLGIGTLEVLGYRDSGMAGTPSNQNPASFNMADQVEATGRLVRLIRRYRPQVLMSYDENGSYGHPDHIKAHLVTMQAFDAAGDPDQYPEASPAWQPQKLYFSGRSHAQSARWAAIAEKMGIDVPWLRLAKDGEPPRGLPDDRITTIIDVRPYVKQKRAAVLCHPTQIRSDSFMLQIPEDVAVDAYADERFIRVRSLVDAPTPEDDLFAGLR